MTIVLTKCSARAIIGLLLILGLFFSLPGCAREVKTPLPTATDMVNEPPVNPFLADSPWPMSHRNPYCQASSPYPGPTGDMSGYRVNYLGGLFLSITLAISGKYSDGSRVLWGSTPRAVFKAGIREGKFYYIDKIDTAATNITLPLAQAGLNAAYTLVDCNGTFFAPRMHTIVAYGDEVPGDASSKIVVQRVFEIPAEYLRGDDDVVVGLNILYDGMLAFATSKGTVGVVSRSFDSAHFLQFGEEEEMSNSIACDEEGGIYVVTCERLYRVQWTGDKLTTDESEGGWVANYETGTYGMRLSKGSGTTPTLMGTGEQDRFVVITDGQELMHVVLFWRDEIPSDWVQIPGIKDRRIAAQVPVTFGDPGATASMSEQSPCVRGYGIGLANNLLNTTSEDIVEGTILSQDPAIAPYGAEKFEWDPGARELRSVWVNKEVSLPNGIPAMSSATNLFYDVGQRGGNWTWEALDWDTGELVFYYEIGAEPYYNSAWAATEVGLDGSLYSGCLSGMMGLFPA